MRYFQNIRLGLPIWYCVTNVLVNFKGAFHFMLAGQISKWLNGVFIGSICVKWSNHNNITESFAKVSHSGPKHVLLTTIIPSIMQIFVTASNIYIGVDQWAVSTDRDCLRCVETERSKQLTVLPPSAVSSVLDPWWIIGISVVTIRKSLWNMAVQGA